MKKAKLFHIIIASGFGSGFSPFAPGTAGALVAVIIWTVLFYVIPFNVLLVVTSLLIVLFTAAGIWSADKLESEWGKDPSKVVVDEMVGVWIALLAVPEGNIWYILFAFLLFRFFDIFKPLGIRKMEQLDGGIGVMADDILAGIYSFLLLMGVRWLIG
ncbi:MAG: phosphatidylglycerophosphatase A [Tannerella sp.]|uniref:phosphatidylglycerophosphatase A family protein n=1 Tax=uncultured Coprobacter sp. TaxID=1720550 RepID=UPI0026065BCC|nr:phosphatidylglycerophosphatase A [uncultured Coprobacter sp.]MBS6268521.1 phosphatidylglycerophosphatase A [Tannerella sp.]